MRWKVPAGRSWRNNALFYKIWLCFLSLLILNTFFDTFSWFGERSKSFRLGKLETDRLFDSMQSGGL
ncbi:hypothetical protein ACFFNY_31870 [Paenibacillus hodogayensis]|uniref:Uncharacterized protein n=1 Tax=Paenibacillus hodogayensis TaxID=279208 RepID=A0ABV5W6J7_9BACL